MAGRHEDHGTRTAQVSVMELIDRIAGEGKPFRLAESSERVVATPAAPGDWQTGELPRVTLGDPAPVDGGTGGADVGEDLWGNRGPRPYQGYGTGDRGRRVGQCREIC